MQIERVGEDAQREFVRTYTIYDHESPINSVAPTDSHSLLTNGAVVHTLPALIFDPGAASNVRPIPRPADDP